MEKQSTNRTAAGRFEFIIWAPAFNPDSGGMIALHALCQRLNQAGYSAALWPNTKPAPRGRLRLPALKSLVGYLVRRNYRYNRGPFRNPVAKLSDLVGATVIYPEVVAGNPLMAKNVVRWLLHRPGYHTGEIGFGPDDLFFFYQHGFDDPAFNSDPTNRLTVTWVNEVYRDLGKADRGGACYLLRKGKDRASEHDFADAIPIDDLDHESTNLVFNSTCRLYSFDLYTLYNVYAAICGCIPIIVPEPGLTKEQWLPAAEDRYGLAYGEEEIPWAVATRDKMLERFRRVRAEEEEMLQSFVQKCRARFEAPA